MIGVGWQAKEWRPARPGDAAWDDRLVTSSSDEPVTWLDYKSVVPAWTRPEAFAPDFDPDQMAKMGVFGDAYWGGLEGAERFAMLELKLYPFVPTATRGDKFYTNHRGKQCARINHFGRPASLTRDWWLDRQLIHATDPLGWYEWYWWYTLGRRIPAYDAWQIGRWLRFKERHGQMYRSQPVAGQAQALLHWGIRAPDIL
jgi:hypothetical protein